MPLVCTLDTLRVKDHLLNGLLWRLNFWLFLGDLPEIPPVTRGGFRLLCQAGGIAIQSGQNVSPGILQNGFFADFYFWAAGFFRGFSRRIFSPHFCGKKCPEKSSRKIPGKILQNLYNKILQHISADCPGQQNVSPGILQSESCANFTSWRCEFQYEFLSEFQCEFLRSVVACLGRFKWSWKIHQRIHSKIHSQIHMDVWGKYSQISSAKCGV